jgi:superfamily II DNA or RNA helicase
MNVEITRFDGGLQFKPAIPYLTKYLRYHARSMEQVHYKTVSVYKEKILYTEAAGCVYTLPGFYDALCKLITKKLDTFTTTDRRTPLPDIDWERVKRFKLRDYQIPIVADLLVKGRNGGGVINAAGGIGKTHIAAVTYAAWNNLNTVLAIPLKEVVRQTYKKFKEFFPEKHIGLVGDGVNDISNDITITTFRSLKNCALEKCKLLLVDEMQSAGSPSFSDCLGVLRPIRMFGFSATTDGLFNNSDKLLVGMFGEDLVHFPYIEAREAQAVVPCIVYMLKLPDSAKTCSYKGDDLRMKLRQGINRCKPRHTLLGEVCAHIPETWQTIIFVDHVKDHLVDLYKYLPVGTKYLHRESSKANVGSFALSNKQQKEIAESFANNEFQFLLATDAFRAGVDIPNCRVVIQGAGGSSKVEVLQEALRGSRILTAEQREKHNLTEKTHFILIDFMDNHDDALFGMAEKRIKYYEEQGWQINIVDDPKQINWTQQKQK